MLDKTAEREVVERLQENPPDWIIVTSADFSFWGVGRFGSDFYGTIGQYISSNYTVVKIFSQESPSGAAKTVIALFRKK